ncbi:MAG: hypothetical protein ACKOOH_09870 [Cyanobium sp.]
MEHAPHNHPNFVAGRSRLGHFVGLLLSNNGLSHQDLQDFAVWAAIDDQAADWLSKSQISTLRNAKLPKPGAQLFLALACVNQRLAELCLKEGEGPARDPLPQALRHLAVVPGPWFLENPETGEACDEGDLFRIYCGRLKIPELEGSDQRMSAQAVNLVCERLALLAHQWMKTQDFPSPKTAREALLELYPVKEHERRTRVWEVIQQVHDLTPDQFEEERDALRLLVGRLQSGQALSVREFDRWLAGSG